ncbi:hypothetical protein ACLB2K_045665 [Fragaria x ananassa]
MVVVEAVQFLASSKENVSPTATPSHEKLGRIPMEYGLCFSHTKSFECKRRRACAVRDFPLGCGLNAQLGTFRPVNEVASVGTLKEEMATTVLLDRNCFSPPDDGSNSVSNKNGPEKIPEKKVSTGSRSCPGLSSILWNKYLSGGQDIGSKEVSYGSQIIIIKHSKY